MMIGDRVSEQRAQRFKRRPEEALLNISARQTHNSYNHTTTHTTERFRLGATAPDLRKALCWRGGIELDIGLRTGWVGDNKLGNVSHPIRTLLRLDRV